MLISRVSMLTGKPHAMDLPITPVEIACWELGEYVQDAFPELTPEQREFFLTGITPEEWEQYVGVETDTI